MIPSASDTERNQGSLQGSELNIFPTEAKASNNNDSDVLWTAFGGTLRAEDILHLLQAYQGVINSRPLEMGNREFLSCLLVASRRLGETLADMHKDAHLPSDEIAKLLTLLKEQTLVNAKEVAVRLLLTTLAIQQRYSAKEKSPHLYLRGALPVLCKDYTRITVIFGPALGLGDQIAFFQFLRQLVQHCPQAQMTIFTLYPNLWRHLLPKAREIHYREKPLRPFLHLEMRRSGEEDQKELVFVADFDSFDFHRKVISRKPNRDILEIALGRQIAWLNRGRSPWIRFEDFLSSPIINNYYYMLAKVAERLFSQSASNKLWEALNDVERRPSSRREKVLLLNPFTSKPSSLEPQDWYQILQRVRADLPEGTDLQVIVFPGLHPLTLDYASKICRLSSNGPDPVNIRLLEGKGSSRLTPFGALPSLLQILNEVDLCLTVDTFTGHLVPLFKIPTIVVTNRENREFWVPSPWSFYCLPDRLDENLPGLLLHFLTLPSSTQEDTEAFKQAKRQLVSTTSKASENSITLDWIRELQLSLAELLQGKVSNFPYFAQAQQWLLLWSSLASALHCEAVDTNVLQPYLYRWKDSEFFKLIAMELEQ